jgi:hypothetical protein
MIYFQSESAYYGDYNELLFLKVRQAVALNWLYRTGFFNNIGRVYNITQETP